MNPISFPAPRPLAHDASMPQPDRSVTVDNARAIGIVLVVVGHAPSLPPWLTAAIFTFHMPLFFLLSGLLVSPQRLGSSIVERARDLARTLLVPYLFYFAIAWVYWLVAKRHGLRADEFATVTWWHPVTGLLLGTGDALYVDPALWFFPCLFVTALAYHALRKGLSPHVTFTVLTVSAFAMIMFRPADAVALAWSIDCALVGVAFFAAGPLVRNAVVRPAIVAGERAARAVVATLATLVCFALPAFTGRVSLSDLDFGRWPILYLPGAACGTLAMLLVASLLPKTRVAGWLSANTLVVFPLHMLFFSVVTGLVVVSFHPAAGFKDTTAWMALPYLAGAFAASWMAARVLRRFTPWLFARRLPISRNPT